MRLRELISAHLGHADIDERHVELHPGGVRVCDTNQRVCSACFSDSRDAEQLQQHSQAFANVRIVVDNERALRAHAIIGIMP